MSRPWVAIDQGSQSDHAITRVDAKLLEGRASFSLSKSNAVWKGVDGGILPIFGEVPLTIRFQDSVVDIKSAKGISYAVYPLNLGVDWISASEASIINKQGIMEVPCKEARGPKTEKIS